MAVRQTSPKAEGWREHTDILEVRPPPQRGQRGTKRLGMIASPERLCQLSGRLSNPASHPKQQHSIMQMTNHIPAVLGRGPNELVAEGSHKITDVANA